MAPTMARATQTASLAVCWLSGSAAMVGWPNMRFSPPSGCARTGFEDRPGTCWQRLRNDLVTQIRLDRRVRGRSDLAALLREILVGLRGERRGGAFASLLDPGREGVLRQRLDLELHVGEAVA